MSTSDQRPCQGETSDEESGFDAQSHRGETERDGVSIEQFRQPVDDVNRDDLNERAVVIKDYVDRPIADKHESQDTGAGETSETSTEGERYDGQVDPRPAVDEGRMDGSEHYSPYCENETVYPAEPDHYHVSLDSGENERLIDAATGEVDEGGEAEQASVIANDVEDEGYDDDGIHADDRDDNGERSGDESESDDLGQSSCGGRSKFGEQRRTSSVSYVPSVELLSVETRDREEGNASKRTRLSVLRPSEDDVPIKAEQLDGEDDGVGADDGINVQEESSQAAANDNHALEELEPRGFDVDMREREAERHVDHLD